MMDKNKIFIVFDEEVEKEEFDVLFGKEDEMATNIYTFSKIINNHFAFCNKLKKLLHNKDQYYTNVDESIKSVGFKNFNRSYFYIKNFDLYDITHLNALNQCFEDEEVIQNFNLAIEFFETEEEYEKCNFLLKIIKKGKEFLK